MTAGENQGSALIFEDKTPDDFFFGSVTYVLDTGSPWRCDLGNNYYIDIIPWNDKGSPDYWEPVVEYRLYLKSNDENTSRLLSTSKLPSKDNMSALRLSTDADMTIVTGPQGVRIFNDLTEHISALQQRSCITVTGSKKAKSIKRDIQLETYPEINHLDIYELENLIDESPHTGIWNYLDRVTPKNQHVKIGGKYKVAIIPDSEKTENLLIVYIDGDTSENSIWQPGDVKGYLTPTGFDNHYDLIWLDKHRFEAGLGECSATFDGINLLTLDFPLLESQIRFQKEL